MNYSDSQLFTSRHHHVYQLRTTLLTYNEAIKFKINDLQTMYKTNCKFNKAFVIIKILIEIREEDKFALF